MILHNIDSNLSNRKLTRNNEREMKMRISLPYIGVKGGNLIKSIIKKIQQYFNEKVTIVTNLNDKKVSMFSNNKDKLNFKQKSNVIYEFTCPGCQQQHIEKIAVV